jgi:hypothetical protein
MNVGGKQWMRNFRLSRTIIHGTWFLAPLMLKPSVGKWVFLIKLRSDETLN